MPGSESLALTAFWFGVLSAASLPIGAITSFYWRPEERTVAALMAFGGGALLAALTIDLVASALEKGHAFALTFGCVAGGLAFVGLNNMVNDYGGFLRKASTTIYHLRKQDHLRLKRLLSQLPRISIFEELSAHEFKAIAQSIKTRQLREGEYLYRSEDPPDALYVVAGGEIELLSPAGPSENPVSQRISRNQPFGFMAFSTGSPHSTSAVARARTTVWQVPRSGLRALLGSSSTFLQVMHRWLRSTQVLEYLERYRGMSEQEAKDWLGTATKELLHRGEVPECLPVAREAERFHRVAAQIGGLSLFEDLPNRELQVIGSHLLYKRYRQGETLYHQGEPADRLYILAEGEAMLVDPRGAGQTAGRIKPYAILGGLACISGTPRTTSALAASDLQVWELRREDLDELVRRAPAFRQALRDLIGSEQISRYLSGRQRQDRDQIERWTQRFRQSLETGQPLPAIGSDRSHLHDHGGAALAIWLGILLDGIPESLVIGASLVHSGISLSLIVGLVLSNYPEALSSSVGMRRQGFSRGRILFLWTTLVAATGIGAALGNLVMADADPFVFAAIEGLAAGAMLTMIAQTMLPEAYIKGGNVVGLSTLFGFLAAILASTVH
jgi:CRP-like cAMP-binding protein